MNRKILTLLKRVNWNLRGWRTSRKIVVIESDDWGSIRMPSKKVYNNCLREGYPVDKNPYERNDSLASDKDLDLLFDLLYSFRDKNLRNPIVTANCVVANPDFSKIEDSNYKEYHFELITETFKRYPNHANNINLWIKGKDEKLFFPQYHAREHLNISKYMKALSEKDVDVHFAFRNQMLGALRKRGNSINNYVESTNFSDQDDKKQKLEIYLEGLSIFKDVFGYLSKSIIPTNFIWSDTFDSYTSRLGVEYIQGAFKMKEPNDGKFKYHKRILGKTNNYNQIAMVRNCIFEPALTNSVNAHLDCLRDIEIAFALKKPAIISSHRVNYVGVLQEKNRDRTLYELKKLLKILLKKHPTVEFMSTVDLGDVLKNNTVRVMKEII